MIRRFPIRYCLLFIACLLPVGCLSPRLGQAPPSWQLDGPQEPENSASPATTRPPSVGNLNPQSPVAELSQSTSPEPAAQPRERTAIASHPQSLPLSAIQSELPSPPPDFELQSRLRLADTQPTHELVRGQSPAESAPASIAVDQGVQPTTYQYPVDPQTGLQLPTPQLGAPNDPNPILQQYGPAGVQSYPQNYADLDVYVTETMTGKINIGGAYNSDNGLVGQFVIDERNFDLLRFPRSFREIVDGTAWRGAGQGFRLELVPGNRVQRYVVSFTEPYLLDTNVSLSVSGFLFSRNYFDWDEERLGGRVSLGYRLTPDVSISAGLRMENVELSNPRVLASPELNASLGDTDLYMGQFSLINDTRDHPFLPTDGMYLALTYSQAFGEVDFPRGDIEVRRYRLMYQRPDGSGRHTVSFGTRLGFSGSDTPIFENYFAGGFSTMRGFEFRGASPMENGVRVGGEFQWLNTVEYMFPITADDMVKGVVFCDFGTIEREIDLHTDNFRVAPGFGFRVHMPAAGMGAPLAFDFAFPVARAPGDEEQVFSFYMGLIR